MSVLIFNLTTYGKPYLHKAIPAKDIKKDLTKTLQSVVGGYIEKFNVSEIKPIIHPMFKQEEIKWRIAEKLMWCKKAKVYGNENGYRDCCPNMATIILNKDHQVGGCPHLLGEIAVSISETEYKKICDEPLDYWKDEQYEDEDEDEEEEEEAD